jgi:hypothetical protein
VRHMCRRLRGAVNVRGVDTPQSGSLEPRLVRVVFRALHVWSKGPLSAGFRSKVPHAPQPPK